MRAFWQRFHKDESGNVLVLYMAASLLIVGLLWAIMGTGQRIIQKETLQASADAASFSATVVKAKGLNIIAFCNLIMALLLAIIIMMRAVVGALEILTLICAFNCTPYGNEELCGMTSYVGGLYEGFNAVEQEIEPVIKNAIEALAKMEQVVNRTFPALAMAEAYRTGTHASYKKNAAKSDVQVIVTPLPIGAEMTLPTQEADDDQLCDEAMKVVKRATSQTVSKVGIPGTAGSLFAGLFAGALGAARDYLCPDMPKPLILADDWKDRKYTRGYSLVTDSNLNARYKAVSVASKQKPSTSAFKQAISTSQAEFYAQWGAKHDDLWHMDWRARLVRYTLTGGADDSTAMGAFMGVLSSVTGLSDYMVH